MKSGMHAIQADKTPQACSQALRFCQFVLGLDVRDREGEALGVEGAILWKRRATHTPHHTRRRFPSPCFSLALAAEQMAQMPLTGRGCLQGANVGRGFPSPLALVPADHTSRPALGHSRLLFTCRCVSVFGVCVCTCPNGRGRTQDGLTTGRWSSTKTSDPETGLIFHPRPVALSMFIQMILACSPLPPSTPI